MKKTILLIHLLIISIASYSQSKEIIGSWIFRDSISTIQLFIKAKGTIEERTGISSEDIWNKTPRIGTYTFNEKGKLTITWADHSVENRQVKFKDNFSAAEIQFTVSKNNSKKTYLFLRIVDEEVIMDK